MKALNKKDNVICFFASLCLLFSTFEYLLPKPVPFMRLGLANIPIIISFEIFSFKEILILVLLKILSTGLINGTFLSYVFLFSFFGSFVSFISMYLVYKIINQKYISYIGISLIGALSSNLIQIFFSVYFIFGLNSIIILPTFLLSGLISGFIIGYICVLFKDKSLWFKELKEVIYKN